MCIFTCFPQNFNEMLARGSESSNSDECGFVRILIWIWVCLILL
jgi:hypothetical protein